MQDLKSDKVESPASLTGLPSYLMMRITHAYKQSLHEKLKPIGLNMISTRIVVSLKMFQEMTVSELCVHAIAEQPTMSRALDKLEGDGIVERRVSEEDHRARAVRLTEKGAGYVEKILPGMLGLNEKLMQDVPEADRVVFMRTLLKVLENADGRD
ncbi:MarR family transcriptional regulator [Alisedimentitalea sp. MJ-SS2]|uniref:MarR family winged helix-turn-helix transcriptional regulator n=1 Tax=Aliisedimentitalea sp. MJ-SS2 TaxID=3049795 RepID=UPI002914B6B2|nr:MarR family transcriptional regulator [Alisedimentitalea sp. MJ-SS2]MDU8925827.1 MarR family transcriptional regulator [Alisedimentitalea sp. MJ-SS2]